MRKRTRAGIVAALATALVTLTSTAAYASDVSMVYYDDNDRVTGGGIFYGYGEKLNAFDERADGLGIYVHAEWSAGGTRLWNSYWLTSGAGTSHTLDLDIAEGTRVDLKVCQTDNGSLRNCRYATATA